MPNQLENIASEGAGMLKEAKARALGLTGVFAHLAKEHGEVTALLLRVKASSDPSVRDQLFPRIRIELLSHEKGELAEVYPVFREHPELMKFADQHDSEARNLEQQIALVTETSTTDPTWQQHFQKLVDLVSEHVKEEEGTFFPEASRVLGREESNELLSRFERAKAEAVKEESA